MQVRRRFEQMNPLKDRSIQQARNFGKQAEEMPGGIQREELLKKARQAEVAAYSTIRFRPQVCSHRTKTRPNISLGINILLRMKGGLVGLRTLDGLRDAIEDPLVGYHTQQSLIFLDLLVELDACLAHF
jgi:hypothetical protein